MLQLEIKEQELSRSLGAWVGWGCLTEKGPCESRPGGGEEASQVGSTEKSIPSRENIKVKGERNYHGDCAEKGQKWDHRNTKRLDL